MSTLEQLAEGYANRLREADDPDGEVPKLARAIRELRYDETQRPISLGDKERILESMQQRLVDTRMRTDSEGRTYILKEADNQRYLELVRALRELLG